MSLLVVRHARAKSRQRWDGDDPSRPLTKAGRAQAKALVPVLAAPSPTRVLSSPSLRCTQTVEPLASHLGIPLEVDQDLAEGNIVKTLLLLRRIAGLTAVVCTHGDVIPEVLWALSERDGMVVPPSPLCAKGSTWVLENNLGHFASATYVEPPVAQPKP
ncbi:MAG: SixA phosphatase family protein [Mycobacterium sp.]